VTYLGITDGNMQEGNFRCDANVSVMPKGAKELGTRAEIKNVNSFRFVEKAIEYEINRQIGVVKSGGKVIQETRLYDSAKNITLSMRSKEDAHDYRYFPEPDLLPVQVSDAWIKQIRETLPELPEEKKQRYVSDFGLSPYDAASITASRSLAQFFEKTVDMGPPKGAARTAFAKTAANFVTGEVSRLLNEENIEISASRFTPGHLAGLVTLFNDKVVSSTGAKQVLASAWKSGEDVEKIVEKEGLKQVSDTGALEPVIDQVIAQFPNQVNEFRSGKDKLIGFFVGQVMKASGGKANPSMLQEMILRKLKS
jgi:aspartyl-tRNA(Asn)/glutamyl-tRNA(Gln) amidotransferase subunit B